VHRRGGVAALLACGLALGCMQARTSTVRAIQRGALVTSQAKGTFEVKVKPLPNDEKVAGLTVGRMSIDKQLAGDIEGTSKGEMMTADTSVQGSAGYVAVEQMTGKLKGRRGSFKLLHMGTMKRGGELNLTMTVVPDSGTDQLVGVTGTMAIIIADGKHSYQFDYTLPDLPSPESIE